MQPNLIVLAFTAMTLLPRGVFAQELDVQSCLNQIQQVWTAHTDINLTGKTRTEATCYFRMSVSDSALQVSAVGEPLQISFALKSVQTPGEQTTLQACRVDKEKLHVVFEQSSEKAFEKRERVQMTLLKREGKGLSLILSKRENKVLQPLVQNSLICHLK